MPCWRHAGSSWLGHSRLPGRRGVIAGQFDESAVALERDGQGAGRLGFRVRRNGRRVGMQDQGILVIVAPILDPLVRRGSQNGEQRLAEPVGIDGILAAVWKGFCGFVLPQIVILRRYSRSPCRCR